METDDYFNCDVCGECTPRYLQLIRTLQCVVFENSVAAGYHNADSYDILGMFCSKACMDKTRDELMANEHVSLPSVPLDEDLIGSCAVCHGPVVSVASRPILPTALALSNIG